MELWIRSQDKEALIKVNMGLIYTTDVNDRNCVVNKDNATGYSILGAYQTKERALEVLDEIQNILNPSINLISSQHFDFDDNEDGLIGYNIYKSTNSETQKISEVFVYEMPEE